MTYATSGIPRTFELLLPLLHLPAMFAELYRDDSSFSSTLQLSGEVELLPVVHME